MTEAAVSRKSLFRSFLTLSFGNVTAQLLLLVAFAVLGRALGPEGFGWWSFSYAIMLYLFRLDEFGLEVMGVRAIARGQTPAVIHISTVLTTRLFLAIILFSCASLASATGIIPAPARLLVIILSLAVFPLALSLEWAYEAIQRFEFVSLTRVMKAVLFVGLVLAVVHSRTISTSSAIFYVLSLAVPAVYLLFDSLRRFGRIRFQFSWRASIALLKESLPVGVATFLSQFCLFFATLYLGYMATATDIGLFSAAHRLIVFVWAYGIAASNRVLLPTLSRLHGDSPKDFDLLVIRATRLFLVLALPIGVLGALTSQSIIVLVYGASYSMASPVFTVLLWVLVIAISRSAAEISYWASDRQRLYVTRILLLVVAHSVAVPIGYALDGIRGVAIGMLCAESLYTGWLVLGSGIVWNRSIVITVGRALAAALITFVGLLLASMSMIPTVIIGLAAYGGLLFATGEISAADREMVRGLFRLRSV
ncbi:MAG: oligosaccharide flippase family protein [Ignavibacteriales bacterium]|nr:oligosaccharide flippase family protein [Ignavibacteriales bacterium]